MHRKRRPDAGPHQQESSWQSLSDSFSKLSAPIPAEMYMAASITAVVLGGLIMGGNGGEWIRDSLYMDRLVFVGLVAPILAVYQFILLGDPSWTRLAEL
jgi:hypothetical protein